MQKASFILAGVFIAGLIFGVILLTGIFTPKYDPFGANIHTTCGEPATMRAETYNLLGGTRYGRTADDPGDDMALANVDLCHPVVEVRPDGEERLWFWYEVEVIGQVFPYAAWGLPWEDIGRVNPADDRNPIDPVWNLNSLYATGAWVSAGSEWAGVQARLCPDWDQAGLLPFFGGPYGFTIPYGTTKGGWVCLTFSGADVTRRLPPGITINSHPERARLTRWVDHRVLVNGVALPDFDGQPVASQLVTSPEALCRYAEDAQPGSTLSGGVCAAPPSS